MSDVFSDTLTGLWNLLLADAALAALILPGNCVRFDSANDRQPMKPQLSTADLPEMIIKPTSGQTFSGASSTSHKIVKNWGIEIATGDQRYPSFMSPVQWRIACAFNDTLDTLPGVPAVRKLRLMTDTEIMQNGTAQGVPRGWAMVAAIMTELWIPKVTAAITNVAGYANELDVVFGTTLVNAVGIPNIQGSIDGSTWVSPTSVLLVTSTSINLGYPTQGSAFAYYRAVGVTGLQFINAATLADSNGTTV